MQAKSLRSGETATDLPARWEKPRLSFRYSLDSSYLCFFPYRLRKFVEILNRLSRNRARRENIGDKSGFHRPSPSLVAIRSRKYSPCKFSRKSEHLLILETALPRYNDTILYFWIPVLL